MTAGSLTARLLPVLLAAALGCADPPSPERALVPRLASGETTTARAVEPRVVAETLVRKDTAGVQLDRMKATWIADLQEDKAASRGFAGVFLEPEGPGPPGSVTLAGLDWKAEDVTAVSVRAFFHRYDTLRMYFRRADEPRFQPANRVDRIVRPAVFMRDEELPVVSHPEWKGTIVSVRFHLVDATNSFVLDRVRTVARGMAPGASPAIAGGELLDAGLLALEHEPDGAPERASLESRRAFPALAGEPLSTPAPRRPLHVSWALPPHASRLDGAVRFTITADGKGLLDETLDPERDAGRWFTAELAIPAGSGRAELVLATEGGAEDGAVNGLWGPLLPAQRERATSVLLITADTLRADHVGAYGATEVETPAIDALAARGACFLDALAPSNATSPSHATILTGLYPKDHGVVGNQLLLPESARTLAELLRSAGRVTLASSAVRHLNSGLSGMGQGFDLYFETPRSLGDAGVWVRAPYRAASPANDQVLGAIEELGERPFFAWVHYYDAHTPYEPEPEYAARAWTEPGGGGDGEPLLLRFARRRLESHGLAPEGDEAQLAAGFLASKPHLRFLGETRDVERPRAMYRAEVAQLDRDVGRLLAGLEALGRLDDTLVVFTADHGEALGERDVWYDHEGVYDNTLRVPLILAGPGIPGGLRSDEPAALTDVLPTVADLLDLPLTEVRGVSLVPALQGRALPERRRWFQHADNREVGFQTPRHHVLVARMAHHRGTFDELIPEGHLELYDLVADPGQTRNLAADDEASRRRAEKAARDVEEWLEDRLIEEEVQRPDADAADAEALRALGYAGD